MRNKLYAIFFIVFFFGLEVQLLSQPNDLSDTQISILTCRSGDELYTTFGHAAIRVFSLTNGIDRVFNYGIFQGFGGMGFYVKFLRGQLPYYVASYPYQSFLEEYLDERRTVIEQVLILDDDQKRYIINYLIENVKPENREYKYDFYYDNCSTRLVDIYESTTDSLIYDKHIPDYTFRDLMDQNLHSLPWSDFGIDLVIGQRADIKAGRRGQMYLPDYLREYLASAYMLKDGVKLPLAKPTTLVLDFEKEDLSRKTPSFPYPLLLTLAIFVITLMVNIRTTRIARHWSNFLLIFGGVLGLFLLFMWFGTDHNATRDNWNVLWLSPFFLLLVNSNKYTIYLSYICLLFLLIAGANTIFQFLPQRFNMAFLPWIGAYVVIIISRKILPHLRPSALT